MLIGGLFAHVKGMDGCYAEMLEVDQMHKFHSTMNDNGGEESSTSRNAASTVESPLFSTVKPKVFKEPVALKIASVTYTVSALF